MTPQQWAEATVKIATGLLGWGWDEDQCAWMRDGDSKFCEDPFVFLDGCAEFERELAKRGWLSGKQGPNYQRTLWRIVDSDQSDFDLAILATPEQRVQACLRVMEDAGL